MYSGSDELFFQTIDLLDSTFQGEWGNVVHLYETEPQLRSRGITTSNDTALHVAINDKREDIVQMLVGIIKKYETKEALIMKNERGNTPLHLAAARGSVRMCDCLLRAGQGMGLDLLSITNTWGEAPIFMAAVRNHKLAFIFLHDAATDAYSTDPQKPYQLLRRTIDGETVLHTAIWKEHLDLAFHITRLYPDLLDSINGKGMTPLHHLASKPSVFRSGSFLSWWQKIIYFCIHVDPLKYDPRPATTRTPCLRSSKSNCPENYLTCCQFLSSCNWYSGEVEDGVSASLNNSHTKEKFPPNYATFHQFLAFVCRRFCVLIGCEKIFTDTEKVKQNHTWSIQILDELMRRPYSACMKDGGNPIVGLEGPVKEIRDRSGDGDKDTKTQKAEKETDTALVAAARNGVIEVVDKILRRFPQFIPDTASTTNKNILLLAVENKQPGIFVALHKHLTQLSNKPKLWDQLIQSRDSDGNTVLHLAAKYDESLSHAWLIYGSAMQMQCEVKWYEYVKSFLPPFFVFSANKYNETPGQIFTRDHKELVKNSGEWLNRTSEFCSVVATLVAGVTFATSCSVPGGNDDKTGKPTLGRDPVFELFAIAALIGLCCSVTALIMFLSILTSRKQPTDFRKSLPLKLLLALSSLFLSIVSMLISFCAAHSFVLEGKLKKSIVLPLYAAACLPVSFTIAEFPVYVDLLKAIVMEIPRPYDMSGYDFVWLGTLPSFHLSSHPLPINLMIFERRFSKSQ